MPACEQGSNHGWKVEGDQGLGPNTGALAPRALPKATLGVEWGRGRPLPLCGSGGITPGKFVKTQMLNFAFWWLYLLWNFLLFENYGQEVGGTNTLLVSQPKSWGTSLPRSLRLLRLCLRVIFSVKLRDQVKLNGIEIARHYTQQAKLQT